MKCLLFVLLVVSFVFGEKQRFDNYQVLRIDISNETRCGEAVHEMAESLLADVWAASCMEGWVDVMVSPEQKSHFVNRFTSEVRIPDVQATLDVHYAEMNQTRGQRVIGQGFDYFPTTGEVRQWIYEIIATYPTLAKQVNIGRTNAGALIDGLVLTRGTNNPIFYIHCGIHAREWITPTTCVYIVEQLLTVENDLLDYFEWIIVPIFNIDGYDFSHTSNRLWRKSREGPVGGCYGTDLNRNYPYGWSGPGASPQPCSDTYYGSAPSSTWEVYSEEQFLSPLFSRIISYVDIHSYGGYLLSSWGYTNTLPVDYNTMSLQMNRVVPAIRSINGNNYLSGPSGRTLYTTSGSTVDWMYGEAGVVAAYTIECAGNNFTPPPSSILPIGREVNAGIITLARTLIETGKM
jgi:carboxypeptidase A1